MRIIVHDDILSRLHDLVHLSEVILQESVNAINDAVAENHHQRATSLVVLSQKRLVQTFDRIHIGLHVLRVVTRRIGESLQLIRQLAVGIAPCVNVCHQCYTLGVQCC